MQLQRAHQRLVQVLCKAMAGEQRLREDVQRRLSAVADHTTLQRRADRLMCCPDLQRSGLTNLLVADPMGGPRESIALDPEKTILANAQRLYQKARKLRRSRQVLEPRLDHHGQRLATAGIRPWPIPAPLGRRPSPISNRLSWRSWRMSSANWT